MSAALPAFLAEAVFYLASIFEGTLAWFGALAGRRVQALLVWVSALVPYLIFSLLAGTFERHSFLLLAFLSGVFALWFVLLPRRPAYDAGFLVIAAAPILLHVFKRVYISPDPQLRVDVLGHLMWIRLGIVALLIFREWDPGAFGPWPRAHEWRIGLLYYAAAIVPIALLALALKDVRFAPMQGDWWQVAGIGIGTFFGILWVVAISEELFFRGVIERALLNGWRSKTAAVLISAVLFGSVHLWFHQFPNWQRALVATVLGIACGIAYAQSGSVRAPMVTHAFVVATWRVLFK
ncbi:MAG TPA: CPBP family intramembrane glutamic endopeptidase [Bryobacteraceae bacterium]|jgi:membrane protease YdiL (CAAX protease family)